MVKFREDFTGFVRGHKVKLEKGKIVWVDTGETAEKERQCKRCGKMPTKEGHDYCLRNLKEDKEITSACCGHGIKEGYIIKKLKLEEKQRKV